VLLTFQGEEEAEAQGKEEAELAEESRERPEAAQEREGPAEESPEEERETGRPVPAAPSTRRLARQLEVDLSAVPASGPGGRVTAEDVRAYAEEGKAAPEGREVKEAPSGPEEREEAPEPPERPSIRPSTISAPALPDFTQWGSIERVPLRSVRRTIAQRMARAWSQIPHVTHQDVADVTEIERFRQQYEQEIEEQGGQLTLTVLAIKAVVAALKEHPRFNASLDAGTQEIVLKHYYHLGIAVDTDRGLIVPVIRDVDRKSLTELSIELVELAERTRSGEATLEDLQGGTFTITNVGPIGGTAFNPLINFPQVAILGMARARWKPVVVDGGEVSDGSSGDGPRVEPRYLLPLMLSFDHRVVDGADAARFVRAIVTVLEDPDKLLLAL
jgi:pyruvate dehydrogenase E2 component (dihydrolipoamide acetyltransferase)